MIFDYKQTQADVTHNLVRANEWAFKKVASAGGTDLGAGPENQLFDAHRAEMNDAGWALVSMIAAPTALQLVALKASELSRTSSYELSWKRLKGPSGPIVLSNVTAPGRT